MIKCEKCKVLLESPKKEQGLLAYYCQSCQHVTYAKESKS